MSAGVYASELAAFEAACGDPRSADHVLGWRAAVDRDEMAAFPSAALEYLDRRGLARVHVPQAHGGALASYETLLALSRCLSRRDPAVALTTAMRSWSQLVWIAGSHDQQGLVADLLLHRHGSLCLAASERATGADLLAGDVAATAVERGFRLEGEKWPIGLGASADVICVLARTAIRGGARGYSWFLLERRRLPAGRVAASPRLRTHGLRAAELVGLRLDGAVVDQEAMVGRPGEGLEITLKLFQVTRALLPGIAVGIADTGLRIAVDFALGRKLYGRRAAELAPVRQALASAYLDLLAAEILLLSTSRGLHLSPHELSVTSLITKIMVPELTGRAVAAAGSILGARSYLREGPTAIFQMMLRDHAAVAMIDGCTAVCLSALATQLPELARGPSPTACADAVGGRRERLQRRFALTQALPAFDPRRLSLTARGSDDVCQGLEGRLLEVIKNGGTKLLEQQSEAWAERYAAWRQRRHADDRAQNIAAAKEYAVLHAAAACAHFHLHAAPGHAAPGALDQLMLAGMLARLLQPEPVGLPPLPTSVCEHVFRRLEAALADDRLLSVVSIPLLATPATTCEGVRHP